MTTTHPLSITILDTTLRDGELAPGVHFSIDQKLQLAEGLEHLGIQVIEAGYPAQSAKDFDDVCTLSRHIKQSILCGLASTKPAEIERLAIALQPARYQRMHLYTAVRLPVRQTSAAAQTLTQIREGISCARQYCADVEWTAFDATRADRPFLAQAVEAAIASGATIVNIPDSMGVANPEDFADLLAFLQAQVANLDLATLSVHCHDDRGYAVENSITALTAGARQIECAIRGLGARKGNADLGGVVQSIVEHPNYTTAANLEGIAALEQLLMSTLSTS